MSDAQRPAPTWNYPSVAILTSMATESKGAKAGDYAFISTIGLETGVYVATGAGPIFLWQKLPLLPAGSLCCEPRTLFHDSGGASALINVGATLYTKTVGTDYDTTTVRVQGCATAGLPISLTSFFFIEQAWRVADAFGVLEREVLNDQDANTGAVLRMSLDVDGPSGNLFLKVNEGSVERPIRVTSLVTVVGCAGPPPE